MIYQYFVITYFCFDDCRFLFLDLGVLVLVALFPFAFTFGTESRILALGPPKKIVK